MGVTLDALHEVQKLEEQLVAIRAGADEKKRQIQIQKRALERQEAIIAEKDVSNRQTQMEIDRLDLDVRAKQEVMDRHREALNRARTNKEYAAILTSINTEKADTLKSENRALELMGRMETMRADTDALIAERDRITERLATAERKLHEYLEATAEQSKRLQDQRSQAAELLMPTVLATFERVAEKHEGQAMAQVVRLHPKRADYACGGCHMSLTLEQINGLKTRDELQLCGSCGMILYLESTGQPTTG